MEARKAFAAAVTDHILKGFPYNLFDAREITGAKAAAALKALEALEHRSVQIGSAHTGARQRATGSMASMDTATILSFLNNAPEDLK